MITPLLTAPERETDAVRLRVALRVLHGPDDGERAAGDRFIAADEAARAGRSHEDQAALDAALDELDGGLVMPISDADFEATTRRGEAQRMRIPSIDRVAYDQPAHALVITFRHGMTLTVPIAIIQGLSDAAPADLAEIEIAGAGLVLHWPRLDEGLWMPGLLEGITGTRRWMADLGDPRFAPSDAPPPAPDPADGMAAILDRAIAHSPHVAPLLTRPRTEAEYDRLVTSLDALLDIVRGDETHPLASLLHRVGDLIAAYDEAHHPMPEIADAASHLVRVTLDLTRDELADLLSALAAWSRAPSNTDPDADDRPDPDLDGATPREARIGELYQRVGAFLEP